MPFIWFWTFWHWSAEGYRTGALLRGPIHGVGTNWDEWFRYEASPDDRRAIAATGESTRRQREFVQWLVRHWSATARWRGKRPPARFVLAQLAGLAPFDGWPVLARYRTSFGTGGVSAVVLAEGSIGDATDVRVVEAIAVPADAATPAPTAVPDGFSVDPAELDTARAALLSLLHGRNLLRFVALWLLTGRRPYPRAVQIALTAGWVAVCVLIIGLVAGPEADERLRAICATLLTVWAVVTLTSVSAAAVVALRAVRAGREWGAELRRIQIRLRMGGGLTVLGGSAGLAFCLNMLRALDRSVPSPRMRSWLWRQVMHALRAAPSAWAATGVLTAEGRIRPVVLAPKLRACLRHPAVAHLITPDQRAPKRGALEGLAETLVSVADASTTVKTGGQAVRLGFAAARPVLRSHPCGDLARAAMTLGGLTSVWQAALNAVAVAVSITMLVALPDLRDLVMPPPAPFAGPPFSPSPYTVWVSLETEHPDDFGVRMESGFWANRRANVTLRRAGMPPRAELRLTRAPNPTARDTRDGTVWVERRRRFLTREFPPGERVGVYSLSYFALPHD